MTHFYFEGIVSELRTFISKETLFLKQFKTGIELKMILMEPAFVDVHLHRKVVLSLFKDTEYLSLFVQGESDWVL